ncbi:hypothetical protein BDZ89DRAFT_1162248 [Hymenopellis radicata]|nr:hypothetical protein BDZ89DRAFT_1162248 [Hymenopellis radicata]
MIFKTISNIAFNFYLGALAMFTKWTQPQPRLRTSTGSFERVPQELHVLDLIISHLVNDKATLLSCALVHTTWTYTSRHHLPSLGLFVSCPTRASELAELLGPPLDTLSPSIAAIKLADYTYESLNDFRTGDVVRGIPRPYEKLILALKHNENTKRRWRTMLWLHWYWCYRRGCLCFV